MRHWLGRMRGSPWFRTLFVAVVLGITAWGIASLTSDRSVSDHQNTPSTPTTKEAAEKTPTRFHLVLSEAASEVVIEADGESHQLRIDGHRATGTLLLDGPRPTIFLVVRWAGKTDTPKFAKLTLEPNGWSTRVHTFDAMGDLDEVWEPDFE